MVSSVRRPVLAVVLIAAAVPLGCGKGPTLHPVAGIVLLDGVPLEGASVGFSPEGPGGLPASAQTTADGTFRLGTWIPAAGKVGTGASAGDYVVMIEKVDAPPVETFSSDDPRYGKVPPPAPKISYIVPQSYGVRETTPLRATVRSGRNAFTFELDSKKP